VVTSRLIVRRHSRRFTLQSPSPHDLYALSVGFYPERSRRALDYPFSFVFLNFQPLTFNLPFRANSFPHNPLSNPHPLNPVVSILYKNSGGRGHHQYPMLGAPKVPSRIHLSFQPLAQCPFCNSFILIYFHLMGGWKVVESPPPAHSGTRGHLGPSIMLPTIPKLRTN